jgi:hypothetical protein
MAGIVFFGKMPPAIFSMTEIKGKVEQSVLTTNFFFIICQAGKYVSRFQFPVSG